MLPDLTAKPGDEQAEATGTDDAVAGEEKHNPTHRIHTTESGRSMERFGSQIGRIRRNSAQTKTAFLL
jgi:hypothetical protein